MSASPIVRRLLGGIDVPLVIPLVLIVRDVFRDRPSKVRLTERNQAVEALLFD